MQGLMQDAPLVLTHFFDRAERLHYDKALVTATPSGPRRTTYGAWAQRTRLLAGSLDALGVPTGARVATFAWNTDRHLELYFAPACSGRVLHTLNIRLFADQLVYIADHAEDDVVFVDASLTGSLWPVLERTRTVRHVVVMDDTGADVPDPPAGIEVHDYESLLAGSRPAELWASDESAAASMCYTSGTTGNPKGVVYSHRSTYLHTMATMLADGVGIAEADRVMPVVPMFHANAWGLAHAGVAAGATLVLPGADLSARSIAALIESERVTVAAGVPTIWMGVLDELDGRDTSSLRAIPCGGSAVPRALSEAYRTRIGLPILQAWGMTETSPVASIGRITATLAAELDEEAQADLRATVGQPSLGVDVRIVRPGSTEELPWDGTSSGELQVHGPWIAASYYRDERSDESFTPDGWLRTGDVAVIDAHGYLRLVDRTKDVIKSGGEWISSVELENELMAHPAVAEAAVIGVTHPRWGERPLACVVLRPGASAGAEDLIAFLAPRVAKWWLPDEVVFVDEIPKTSVGKFSKKDLRTMASEGKFVHTVGQE